MDGWQWRFRRPTNYNKARIIYYGKSKANGPIILGWEGMNGCPLFHIILEACGSADQWGYIISFFYYFN